MLGMRLRLPEILKEHNVTAYEVAQRSGGRINQSALYRLVRQEGRVELFSAALLEALCDVLGVEPAALFERDKPTKKGRAA